MGSTITKVAMTVLSIAVFLAALILIPLLLIWCLNTLGIASASYTVIEWIAAAALTAFFLGGSGVET